MVRGLEIHRRGKFARRDGSGASRARTRGDRDKVASHELHSIGVARVSKNGSGSEVGKESTDAAALTRTGEGALLPSLPQPRGEVSCERGLRRF